MKILLIEDNKPIAHGLDCSLTDAEFEVTIAYTYKEATEFLNKESFDLAILDISLPDGNGVSLYENFLKKKNISTIFLTAKDDEETIVHCLKEGAEDYLTKPFKTGELLVRIEKIIRHKNDNTIVKVKDITFDLDKMLVTKSGVPIELTSLELKILSLLFDNVNKVVRRSTIIDKIWDWTGNDVEENTITVYMKRIREKLGSDIIVTIKGIGYRIDTE